MSEMVLLDKSVPAQNSRMGRGTYTIPAGKALIIESSPNGLDILNEIVPAGKSWSVTVNIDIVESSI